MYHICKHLSWWEQIHKILQKIEIILGRILKSWCWWLWREDWIPNWNCDLVARKNSIILKFWTGLGPWACWSLIQCSIVWDQMLSKLFKHNRFLLLTILRDPGILAVDWEEIVSDNYWSRIRARVIILAARISFLEVNSTALHFIYQIQRFLHHLWQIQLNE